MAVPVTPGGRRLGVVFTPPDPRTWAYPHAHTALFAPRDIDLRSVMEPVGDQGQLGSCTGWAGTAALEAKLRDGQRSALYVYYWDRTEDGSRTDQDTGASMLGLCKALKDFGAPPEDAWPYNISRMSIQPDALAQQYAAKIDSYSQVQGTGMPLLQGLWAALEQGETPLLALSVYQSFERVARDGKVYMPGVGEQVLGGHALCACGWFNDNSAPGGYGWVMVQNSWGTGFGDQGYLYLPAGYFTSGIVREAWVIAVSAPVPPPPQPEPDVTEETKAALLQSISELNQVISLQDDARYYQRAQDPDFAYTEFGEASRIAGIVRDRLLGLLPKVPIDPPMPPAPMFVSPIPAGAVFGKTKWLAGSLGCDLFVPRGTLVVAPADCVIEEIIGGTGLQGGAEMILSLPDKSWAWRYRHVRADPNIAVGQTVYQGNRVAQVYDSSLDQLGNPPAWSQPMPDKYQHLDLSVNKGTDRFNPQGGGGGNYSAYQWMTELGYQGRVLSRTPGPGDAIPGISLDRALEIYRAGSWSRYGWQSPVRALIWKPAV